MSGWALLCSARPSRSTRMPARWPCRPMQSSTGASRCGRRRWHVQQKQSQRNCAMAHSWRVIRGAGDGCHPPQPPTVTVRYCCALCAGAGACCQRLCAGALPATLPRLLPRQSDWPAAAGAAHAAAGHRASHRGGGGGRWAAAACPARCCLPARSSLPLQPQNLLHLLLLPTAP